MLAKRIIPCLDVSNGRVVKGVHFKDLRDAGDPAVRQLWLETREWSMLELHDILPHQERHLRAVG